MDWMPRHRTTARTESLVEKLGHLARDIDDGLLETASLDARGEWRVFRRTWPSAADVRSGTIGLSDDELDLMIGKVLRFREILARMQSLQPTGLSAPFTAAAA
jgi:hypothetical protein